MKIFKLPDLGEGLQEAEIVEWHLQAGDEAGLDQPLVSVETAKAVVEIPSPFAGRVERLFAKTGDIVHIGAPLAGFAGEPDAGEDAGSVVGTVETGTRLLKEAPAPAAASGQHGAAPIRAAPAVRALAHKLSVDLALVTPSGPGGVITLQDVQHSAQSPEQAGPGEEPLRGFRRAMARNMALAQAEVAAATVMDDADIESWPAEADTTIRLVRALAAGCRAEPALNAWFNGSTLTRRVHPHIDLGIAVDLPEGLFVPVLRDVANRAAADLRRGLDRMRADVAARKIPPEEMRGNTITLSNFGMIAGKYAAPVVLPPTVAILGAGRIRPEVVACGGVPVVHRLLPLSLTFDHRIVTGGEAGRFLAAVIADLARPE